MKDARFMGPGILQGSKITSGSKCFEAQCGRPIMGFSLDTLKMAD